MEPFLRRAAVFLLGALPFLSLLLLPPRVGAQGIHQVARSDQGVVATAHPLATLAGLRVLEAGGNAADAAVASAFAAAVVLPSMNSIGGRNQILIRRANGDVYGIDGTTQVPKGYDPATAPRARHGYATIGIPGAVAGLMRLHDEHGSLPLRQVMAPAIDYARHGFRLLPQQEFFQAMAAADLAESTGARAYFLDDDGSPLQAGESLVQEDLAQTLEAIRADAGESFYRGEIARAMAEDMEANGGYVTLEDLASYRAEDSRIVRGSYRGFELVGMDVPAAGAVCIGALQMMETFDPESMRPEEWAAVAGQAIGLASMELGRLGPDSVAARVTSKEWAEESAAGITGPGKGQLRAAEEPRSEPQAFTALPEAHFTTHVSVADADGMAVGLTQTVGPVMGSRVATPGLGFHYAVTLGGYLMESPPGTRARSFVSPFLVLKDGEPFLALGAAGGEKIVSSIVQVVSRVIDGGLSLPEAMEAPRVAMGFNGTLAMETSGPRGWTESQLDRVRAMGMEVTAVDGPVSFALVQALLWDPTAGVWTAVSEPDGEGTAQGIRR